MVDVMRELGDGVRGIGVRPSEPIPQSEPLTH